MSTRLTEYPGHWLVETIAAPGRRSKLPRGGVRVAKGDPAALRAELVRQAEAIRVKFDIPLTPKEPVV